MANLPLKIKREPMGTYSCVTMYSHYKSHTQQKLTVQHPMHKQLNHQFSVSEKCNEQYHLILYAGQSDEASNEWNHAVYPELHYANTVRKNLMAVTQA